MACVTANEVTSIMGSCSLTDAQVDVYIDVAHKLVSTVFATDTTTTDTIRMELERWLTAHMIAVTTSATAVKREKIGDAEIEYAATTMGKGLESTPYGQMVLQLDPTGKMALTGKKGASIYAIKSFED